MGKGKGVKPVVHDGRSFPKTCSHAIEDTEFTEEAIDKYWSFLPPQSKSFILNAADDTVFHLSKIFDFWSKRQNVQYTRGNIGGCTCGAALFLAFMYLKMGMIREARALTINGSFLLQCCRSSIEQIRQAMSESADLANGAFERELSYFFHGVSSTRTPQLMYSYIRSHLPKDYTKSMTSFATLSTSASMRGYINQISDDWKGTSPSRKICPLPSSNIDGKQITIILADDSNNGETISFDIGSSSALKTLFNDYANKRGISLRSLRFSYAGSTLFLSKVGRKSPEELGMRNQDVIMVSNMSQAQESRNAFEKGATPLPSSSKKNIKRRSKKKMANKRAKAQQLQTSVKTLEEDKIRHSKQLTKIHEEAHPQFREIRQRLSNLLIKQSRPKARQSRAAKHEASPPPATESTCGLSNDALGRRACKRRYIIHVGEVNNLYKTTKPSAMTFHSSPPDPLSTLDLHGLTRENALVKLGESLEVWADAAMRGSYPFVKRAVIVCGCGSQILSETVEQWIKANDNVSNAPTARSSRR